MNDLQLDVKDTLMNVYQHPPSKSECGTRVPVHRGRSGELRQWLKFGAMCNRAEAAGEVEAGSSMVTNSLHSI